MVYYAQEETMTSYVQIYCSHYGPGARPVAFVFYDGSTILWDMEDEKGIRDWVRPLDERLNALKEGDTLYTFHADFEIKQIAPLLNASALKRLKASVDLHASLKRRTALMPYPSYRMAALAEKSGFKSEVFVGTDFSRRYHPSRREQMGALIKDNILAMESIASLLETLQNRQRGKHIALESFSPSPFQVEGTSDDSLERYLQRDDLLYREKNGRFHFEADLKWLPYDRSTEALVLESDAPIPSPVPAPQGYLVFGLGDTIYYETLIAYLEHLRQFYRV